MLLKWDSMFTVSRLPPRVVSTVWKRGNFISALLIELTCGETRLQFVGSPKATCAEWKYRSSLSRVSAGFTHAETPRKSPQLAGSRRAIPSEGNGYIVSPTLCPTPACTEALKISSLGYEVTLNTCVCLGEMNGLCGILGLEKWWTKICHTLFLSRDFSYK